MHSDYARAILICAHERLCLQREHILMSEAARLLSCPPAQPVIHWLNARHQSNTHRRCLACTVRTKQPEHLSPRISPKCHHNMNPTPIHCTQHQSPVPRPLEYPETANVRLQQRAPCACGGNCTAECKYHCVKMKRVLNDKLPQNCHPPLPPTRARFFETVQLDYA